MREEEAEALNAPERLDEEMMTLAEMQSVLKRKKPKVKMPRSFKKGQVWAELLSGK
ncbi:unnamed protein product [Brassica oleracea]|uniref:(rape) hypothetical protein n=1 Tax=Brassica napus TaxID=3708 RepID=A0A816N2U3_BRANA|nr:unnamed protein product [Brassica napus]